MKRVFIIMILGLVLCSLPQESQAAQSSSLELVFWDCIVGAGIGALVGTASLAFASHPSDHYDHIAKGASIGLLCGLGYGAWELRPMYTSSTNPSGQKDRIYGLCLNMRM
jgi:hypothetical protein